MVNLLKMVIVILIFTASHCKGQNDRFVDSRDGKIYKTVKIGNHRWMAENLAFATEVTFTFDNMKREKEWQDKAKYPNGHSQEDWNDYNNNFAKYVYCYNDSLSNCKKYGGLYTWMAAIKSCPVGWHIPSRSEFDTLLSNVGASKKNLYNSLVVGGSSGFESLLGGYLWNFTDTFARFGGINKATAFWTSSESAKAKRCRQTLYLRLYKPSRKVLINKNQGDLDFPCSANDTPAAFSVRCVKD